MVSIVTQSSCCSSAVVRDQKVIAQFLCSVLSLCFVLSKWVFTKSNDIYVILWAWGNQWGKHQVTITFDTKNAAAFTPHGYICLKWALFMLGDTTTTTTLDLLLLLLLHMSSHWTTTALHDLCDKNSFHFLDLELQHLILLHKWNLYKGQKFKYCCWIWLNKNWDIR